MSKVRAVPDKLLHPSIPVGFVDDVLQAARHRELPVEEILLSNGLSLAGLQLPGKRISIATYTEVLRELGELTDDAFYGFLSNPVPLKALDNFCYSMVGCRTLDDFIAQANEFYGLFTDEFVWALKRAEGHARISVELRPALPVDYRFIIQSLLLMSLRLYGWLLGEDPALKSVSFTFDKNATDESLIYLFGNHIDYACEQNVMCVDAASANARLSCTREQIALMLKEKRHLFLLPRQRHLLSHEVRRILLADKDARWLDVEEVAQTLNMNPNQLWRRLQREGNSFLGIREQIKRDWALVLLDDPAHTVEGVADQLHYSDVSAFRKAFRKWTGVSPGRYRGQIGA